MTEKSEPEVGSSENEFIKHRSNYLRGTIADGLLDRTTGAIAKDDEQLVKFHGMYQQDDRDLREERVHQKLEPLYSFMVRIRLPGGTCSAKAYLELDELARKYGSSSLRLTTRQTFQFHTVRKTNLKSLISALDAVSLDSIAACGDVNRNVTCNANPEQSGLHAELHAWAKRLSEHFLPQTRAYQEIWLGEECVFGGDSPNANVEPIYGKHYLPRKFKMAIALPPNNDVDLFTNDLGFIAMVDRGKIRGFNVCVGGGMGMTHGDKSTYPRLSDVIGFCTPDQLLSVAECVVGIQRDFGNRKNRKQSRLKYTIDSRGLPWFKAELSSRLGYALSNPEPYEFRTMGDRFGWSRGEDGRYHYTLFVMSGRLRDTPEHQFLTGLREIALNHEGQFRVTCNQNLVISGVSEANKPKIDALLQQYGLSKCNQAKGLRLNALACVAFPTCSQAMAEAERYLPTLLDKLEAKLEELGLDRDEIVIRMTGCPNGCARPYNAEIGLVGKAPGLYNLYLGASHVGDRLSKLYRESLNEAGIVDSLSQLFTQYANSRNHGERFGDFALRTAWAG